MKLSPEIYRLTKQQRRRRRKAKKTNHLQLKSGYGNVIVMNDSEPESLANVQQLPDDYDYWPMFDEYDDMLQVETKIYEPQDGEIVG